MRTRRQIGESYLFSCFLSYVEPKNVVEALVDPDWTKAMQEELHEFSSNEVWSLIDRPNHQGVIGMK